MACVPMSRLRVRAKLAARPGRMKDGGVLCTKAFDGFEALFEG
jgi:hypothetical protein